MVALMFYIVTQFVRTVQRDVDMKVDEYSSGKDLALFLISFFIATEVNSRTAHNRNPT